MELPTEFVCQDAQKQARTDAHRIDAMENTKVEPLFVRPAQVAVILQVSRAKAYALINSGAIPSVKIGASLRVPFAALRELAESATAGK